MTGFIAEVSRGEGPVRATGIADPRTGEWIVGHVRLDARDELRSALGGAGVSTARDASDLDLVRAAWRAWRETATERLRGDFTFALWDPERRALFCARDQLGVRPLYWAEFGGAFVCSNELDLVLAHPRATRRLHTPAIKSFLAAGFNDDVTTTSFADVRRLAPAHQMTFSAESGAGAPKRYWSFPVPEPLRLNRDEEYIERFRGVLGDAVRDRLRDDRAAILLSGGLDSTSIAATARRVSPSVELRSWTMVPFPSAPTDEARLAGETARRIGVPNEVVNTETVPFAHLADRSFRSPEPLDDPAWGSFNTLLKRIATTSPVLISGEDGDSLLRPPGMLSMLRTWPAGDVLTRTVRYMIAHGRYPHLGVWLKHRIRGRAVPSGTHPTRPDAHRMLSDPVWQRVLESSQRAWTGVPLDIAWPFLDTRVIEFVFSIPPVPWCQRKEIIRRSFVGELPAEVLQRPKTPLHGFYEWQVAHWRAHNAPGAATFGEQLREFVDTRSVADTLRSGAVLDVMAAWRVLALDHWLQQQSQDGRSR